MSPAVDPTNQLSMVDACNVLNPTHVALGVAGNKINPLSAQLAGLNPITCVVSPASSTVENVFPYLNSATSNSFAPGYPSKLPLNNGLFKGDYVLGPHHHLSGMLFISKSAGRTVPALPILLPQWGAAITNNAQQYSGDWTWTPNSTWVNDFRLGYVFIRNITLVGDGNLIPVESLAERLWHEYRRDESAVRRVSQQSSLPASPAIWGREHSNEPPRSGRRRRSGGKCLVFARQARLQVWL